MQKQVFAQISDDISKVVAKIQRERASDIVLVFPKGSLIIANEAKLKLLKRHVDELGKNISIFTNDVRGREHATAVGFELAGATSGTAKAAAKSAAKPVAKEIKKPEPKPEPKPQPKYEPQPAPTQYQQPVYEPAYEQPVYHRPQIKIHGPRQSRAFGKKLFVTVLVLALLALIFVTAFVLPEANITVYAKSQALSRDLQITVDKNAKAANAQQLVLPGTILDSDEQSSKTFDTTGKQNVGIKAQGNVQIYNYSGRTLKFNAATTTFTIGGMVYHLQNDVSGIRPTTNISGTQNADPKSLSPEVAIIADQPGDLYNIPAGTKLELHNAALGNNSNVYAIAPDAIQNGLSRFTTSVSQDDLNKAAAGLNNLMVSAAKQQLLNVRGLTMLDSGAQVQTNPPVFDKKIGDSAVSFDGTVTGHIKALLFNNESLKTMVEQRVALTLDPNQSLAGQNSEVITATFKTLDLNAGTGILSVHFQSASVPKIDINNLKSSLLGQTPANAQNAVNNPNIDHIDVKLSPFWVKTVPSWGSHVNIQVQIQPGS